MMGGGELMKSGSSLMQQMMWSGTDSKNMMSSSSLMPCAEEEHGGVVSTKQMPPLSSSPSSMLLPQQLLQIPSSSTTTGLLAPPPDVVNGTTATSTLATSSDLQQESSMPVESWSQLLLGGLVGDHERYSAATALLSKGLNEEGPTPQQAAAAYNFYGAVHGGVEIQTNKSSSHQAVSHQMLLASSPRSCITTNLGSNMLDFLTSTAPAPELKSTHQSDNSSESNSNATGSAPKKARVQTSSSAQSTLKVRKERLGDRITALHQIVSPFGKTDTASVLQETIGYIRFLLNQIEALSYPYLGHVGGNADSMQQYPQILLDRNGTRAAANNGMADAGAGQAELLEQQDYSENGGEAANRMDLRSRGLCLVPVSCTSHLADDNSASDFWAVAAAPPPPAPPPAPLGGMFWR